MNIVVLGTSHFAVECIEAYRIFEPQVKVCAVISLVKKKLPNNSFDIESYCRDSGLKYYAVNNINSAKSLAILKKLEPDLLFVSWPQLLSKEVLLIPKIGSIGTHPTCLPYNRGRHPVHWLIFMGITKSALSFFWLDDGVDTGQIILQLSYKIGKNDSIDVINKKINQLAYIGCKKICNLLFDGAKPSALIGKSMRGNLWRKRELHDVLIDCRMSSVAIVRLVKSYATPYPCAKILTEKHIIDIVDAQIYSSKSREKIEFWEPGKIIKIDKKFMIMKCYDGFVKMESRLQFEKDFLETQYIYPPSKFLHKIYKLDE